VNCTGSGIRVVRRSPTGSSERVDLASADHPELYALRELAESLLERIEAQDLRPDGQLPATASTPATTR